MQIMKYNANCQMISSLHIIHQDFWIQWADLTFSVGTGSDTTKSRILSHTIPGPQFVYRKQSLSFRTGPGITGEFQLVELSSEWL